MTSRIHSPRNDGTAKQPDVTRGMQILRMCFTCNERRADRGGRTNRRTRQWSCAGCTSGMKGAKP